MRVHYNYTVPVGAKDYVALDADVYLDVYAKENGDIVINGVHILDAYTIDGWEYCFEVPCMRREMIGTLVNNIADSALADAEWRAEAWERAHEAGDLA